MCLPFFRWLYFHEKSGLEVKIFLTFPNSLLAFRKNKNLGLAWIKLYNTIHMLCKMSFI